ncbi:MAG TPA: 1-deoxy-D-xylulose-5-phosphate reductoisomerase [Terriglobales bacterium]|nr:1-deoxy-D-xylulose-5-phosphate reductoisomerase [Terriglobales bacterium]
MRKNKKKKKVVILGSTGSIGRSALHVLKSFEDRFEIFGISAHKNFELLNLQIREHRPKMAVLSQTEIYNKTRRGFTNVKTKVEFGTEGINQMVSSPEVDIVINAISGSAGLLPSYATLQAGKTLALANKESLVMAGELLTSLARKKGLEILPVDSEHSAIKQCLMAGRKDEVKRLILTASGGPFYLDQKKDLSRVTIGQALSHPTWNMGQKITIDSATLMNKGLEVIEAHWLFGIPASQIKVIIHPQSVVHSMVEFVDGTLIAQMSKPDMKMPLQYALLYPDRIETNDNRLDLTRIKNLIFLEPDMGRFPALKFCYYALELGGTAPGVLNAANEVAVDSFLNRKLSFDKIPMLVRKVLSAHKVRNNPGLEEVLEADRWAREESRKFILKENSR